MGTCLEETYDHEADEYTEAVVFEYAPVAVDLLPAAGAPAVVELVLFRGANPTLQPPYDVAGVTGTVAEPDGSWSLEVPLVGAEPFAAGEQLQVSALCDFPSVHYRPVVVDITAANPSVHDIEASVHDGVVEVTGGGCTSGTVTAWFEGISDVFSDVGDAGRDGSTGAGVPFGAGLGLGAGTSRSVPRSAPDDALHVVEVEPRPDGSWSAAYEIPEGAGVSIAAAECGDPTAGGFRYADQEVFHFPGGGGDLWIERSSPTSSCGRATTGPASTTSWERATRAGPSTWPTTWRCNAT